MRCAVILNRLGAEVQELVQKTAALRATYALNQEKLLYTHHVLSQQDNETKALIPQLKRQLIEQGRALGQLKV